MDHEHSTTTAVSSYRSFKELQEESRLKNSNNNHHTHKTETSSHHQHEESEEPSDSPRFKELRDVSSTVVTSLAISTDCLTLSDPENLHDRAYFPPASLLTGDESTSPAAATPQLISTAPSTIEAFLPPSSSESKAMDEKAAAPQQREKEQEDEGPRWAKARPVVEGGVAKLRKHATGLPSHMLAEKEKPRYKSNSTSSLYIKDTLSTPDIDELLRCMSIALLYHIEAGIRAPEQVVFEIFSEEKHPLTKGPLDLITPPNWKRIYKFISAIFRAERLSSECAILCLAYIERIIGLSKITLNASNWRRVILAALILASKVWEDQAVWNVDFLSVFPCVTVQDLAKLEKTVLNLLQFNVSLKASLYAKYYFELKSLAEQDARHFPLDPLSREDADKLEKRSEDKENAAKKEFGTKMPRSSSDTTAKTKGARMVLN